MSSHASIGAERKIEHTGFQSADPPLLLRYVDNENVALALTGVIKRDSFSVGRPFGRSVATARLGALLNTAALLGMGVGCRSAMLSLDESLQVPNGLCHVVRFRISKAKYETSA